MARDWEQSYREEPVEEMPWFYRDLDPDVARALVRHGSKRGRVLDVGTGPATQAIAFAKLGFDVVGTDVSTAAIDLAKVRAESEGVGKRSAQRAERAKSGARALPERAPKLNLLRDDMLDSKVEGTFDLILDRGCFHVMTDEQRPIYLAAIAARAAKGGLLFLKCFSHEEPGENGPRRYRPDQIEALFSADFEILSVENTVYQGTLDPWPKALFVVMRKR